MLLYLKLTICSFLFIVEDDVARDLIFSDPYIIKHSKVAVLCLCICLCLCLCLRLFLCLPFTFVPKGGCDEADNRLARSVYWLHLQLFPRKLRFLIYLKLSGELVDSIHVSQTHRIDPDVYNLYLSVLGSTENELSPSLKLNPPGLPKVNARWVWRSSTRFTSIDQALLLILFCWLYLHHGAKLKSGTFIWQVWTSLDNFSGHRFKVGTLPWSHHVLGDKVEDIFKI